MTIQVKMLCVDVPPEKSRGTLELPEGALVESALGLYSEKYGLDIPLSVLKKSQFLINKTSAAPDYVLSDGDTLTVMRVLAGG